MLGLDEVVTIMVFVMAISMAFTMVDIMSSKLSVVVMMINKIPYKMFLKLTHPQSMVCLALKSSWFLIFRLESE